MSTYPRCTLTKLELCENSLQKQFSEVHDVSALTTHTFQSFCMMNAVWKIVDHLWVNCR